MKSKTSFLYFLFLILQTSSLASAATELEQHIQNLYAKNTRYSDVVLPAGTQGQILETKALANGDSGLYVNVLNGTYQGNKMWVNHNPQVPAMNFYPTQLSLQTNQAPTALDQAKYFLSTLNTNAFRIPANAKLSKQSAADIMNRASDVNEQTRIVNQGTRCLDCDLQNKYATDVEAASSDFASKRDPVSVNPLGIQPSKCRSLDKAGVVEACTYLGDSSPARYIVTNSGPNSIVSKGVSRYRKWSFEAPGFATQDMMLKLSDSPSSSDKAVQESYIMFFPRKALPEVQLQDGKLVTTLATGEKVIFNAQGKILSGPLSENGALTQGSPAKVSYSGSGITLRVNAAGTDPRISKKSSEKAVISKQGRECLVPKKDLWPDQKESSAMHFNFPTDDSFKSYLQKKCNFSF